MGLYIVYLVAISIAVIFWIIILTRALNVIK